MRLISVYREGGTLASDALLLELDQRARLFVDRRGEEELVRALEALASRTQDLVTQTMTVDFQNERAFQERLARLEKGRSKLTGLRTIENALYCMGILSDRLYPAREEQDPRTAIPAMVDVLWPESPAEEILHVDLASLMQAEPWRPRWELLSVRLFAFSYHLAVEFKDNETAKGELSERVDLGVRELAHGKPCPPNIEKFLEHRSNDYFRLVRPGLPFVGTSPTAFVAGSFAWNCGRTMSLPVRLIGAREWAIAFRRLDSLIAAYKDLRAKDLRPKT